MRPTLHEDLAFRSLKVRDSLDHRDCLPEGIGVGRAPGRFVKAPPKPTVEALRLDRVSLAMSIDPDVGEGRVVRGVEQLCVLLRDLDQGLGLIEVVARVAVLLRKLQERRVEFSKPAVRFLLQLRPSLSNAG